MRASTIYWAAAALLWLAACSDDSGFGTSARAADEPGVPGAGGANDNAGEAQQPAPPPEKEIEVALQTPQGGDRFVFIVSSGLDAVVRIDALTLDVDLIEVGGKPTTLQLVDGGDALLVINEGTQDFSIVRSASSVEQTPTTTTIDAPTPVNRLAVSPDSAWALAWFDPDLPGPIGDLQQVTLLRLEKGAEAAWPIGVGFHVSSVVFAGDPLQAFVVTESGVSAIDVAGVTKPTFAPALAVVPDPFEDPSDREVLITPDGKRAVVRRGGVAELRVVDLGTGEAETLELAGAPTDVDLTLDAKEAIVVIRELALLVRVPVSDLSSAESIDLSGTPAGLATLTPDGSTAILFSTLPNNEWIATLDLSTSKLRAWPLKKGIAGVAPAPNGKSAVIIHDRSTDPASPDDDLEAAIDKAHGYSVLDLESGFAKLELLDSPPGPIAVTPDGAKAWVLIADVTGAGQHMVDDVDLDTLQITSIPMGSPPRSAVFIPDAGRVAIGQEHPVGRITFVDADGGQTETVTGFELNGLIQ